jgi:hypothetical protein
VVKTPILLVVNALIIAAISYPFVWIFGLPNIQIPQPVESSQITAYTFVSVMGYALFIASMNVRESDSSSSDSPENGEEDGDTDIDPLTEGPRLIFNVLAGITMILLFPVSGVVFGILVSTYVSPVLGVVVAIWYPAIDMWLYVKIGRPVTPVTLAVIPLYAVVAVWTATILLVTIALGVLFGAPLGFIERVSEISDDGDLSLDIAPVRRPPAR